MDSTFQTMQEPLIRKVEFWSLLSLILIANAIRIGIARDQWQVAVYLPDKELPKETTVFGTRRDAEIAASSIIDAWIKRRVHEHLNRVRNSSNA
jgi:hypothetical protein